MRDDIRRRYDGENFTTEKVVATLYLVLFVLIAGLGVHKQLSRIIPDAASPAAIEAVLK